MSILLIVPLSLCLVVIMFMLYQRIARPKGFPSGPPIFPLIGSLPFLGLTPCKTFANKWRAKYGDIIGFRMGNINCIVLNKYELIKEAFNQEVFVGSAVPTAMSDLNCGVGKRRGFLCSDVKSWQEQKRFTQKTLKDFGFGKISHEASVHEEIRDLIATLETQTEKSIEITKVFTIPIINTFWNLVTGEKYKPTNPKLQKLVDYFNNIQSYSDINKLAIILFAPSIGKLIGNLIGLDKAREDATFLHKFIQVYIDDHKKTFQRDTLRDYIDVNIQKINNTNTNDLNSPFRKDVGEENLLINCVNLFHSGKDTTTLTLVWAFYYLCNNHGVQRKLQNEIDNIVGNSRYPSLNDRPNMPYTEAVLCEIFRMSSLAPLGVPHKTMKDTEFHGYKIPEGTIIIGNLYCHHYDSNVWGDPKVFRPERFLEPDEKQILKGHKPIIPFSIGKRSCLAEPLARNNIFLFVSCILQRFSITLDPNFEGKEQALGLGRLMTNCKFVFKDRLNE